MATSALQFSHVTLGYENIITTSDLNLTIPQGDYLCIIGENGSGKSTFVKNLLGLLKPLSGEIALTGDWKRSDIGYLPQQTPAQRDFPASVREIVRSGFLNQMKHRPFYTAAEKNAAQQAMEKPLLSGTLRRSATACPTGTGTLCGSKAVDSGRTNHRLRPRRFRRTLSGLTAPQPHRIHHHYHGDA